MRSWSAKHLDPFIIVVSDGLGCFNVVEAIGCGHEAIITTGDIADEIDVTSSGSTP